MEALMKAKVRGLYSTALTKLLLDGGFEIVQPSATMRNRFGLSDDSAPPDVKIKDRYDLQGVRALGSYAAVGELQSLLHSKLEDSLTRKWRVSVDGIYVGKVTESDERTVYVDIGEGLMGKLSKSETAKIVGGNQVIVQVERRRIGAKYPTLTTDLKIVGRYAILTQNSKVGVSLKIRDLATRTELYALGKNLAPDGWGLIWREASAGQSREILQDELKFLAEKAKVLNEKNAPAAPPRLLIEGSCFMDVEFPWISKRSLDELRAVAAPTLDGHHFYKSCGGEVSSALEMAEKLLEKGQDRGEVDRSFKEQILYEFPEPGSIVNVEHVKPSGLVLDLGQATIESSEDNHIKYVRTMWSDGVYDGLGLNKEAGDKAVSQARVGQWCITTKYYSNSGELKGTYVNLNTPVEVYPKAIRYVDLEVDVCILADGTVKVLDVEKLENALEKGFVSKNLFERVKKKALKIAEANATCYGTE
jgi:Ribonuclease G/E